MNAPASAADAAVMRAVAAIDVWFDGMRGSQAYAGPVAHWWQDCLQYAGAGLDWRYQGIVLGYLALYDKTGRRHWLEKARRAGDDLVQGQLVDGRYAASSFEVNPFPGGTPHEAACDLALIKLADKLRGSGAAGWEGYARAAERNLKHYWLGRLWDGQAGYLRNLEHDTTFVPNKAATFAEALLAWVAFADQDDTALLDRYVIPTLDAIVEHQVCSGSSPLHGAIEQGRSSRHAPARYFPLYNARCIPALAEGYRATGRKRYLEAAHAAASFILCHRLPDGSYPQVIYAGGRVTTEPRWIAGAGDILIALRLMQKHGLGASIEATQHWLLAGLLPGGGIRTAAGFGRRSLLPNRSSLPDYRDLLPVCGWVDKAFRFLADEVQEEWTIPDVAVGEAELPCLYHGYEALYHETPARIEIVRNGQVLYGWTKGTAWAAISNC